MQIVEGKTKDRLNPTSTIRGAWGCSDIWGCSDNLCFNYQKSQILKWTSKQIIASTLAVHI